MIRPIPSDLSRPLTIGFLSAHDPQDRRAFSGTVFFAARALAARPELQVKYSGHQKGSLLDRVLRRKPDVTLNGHDFDGVDAVIGMVATPLLDQLSRLRPEIPFLHVTDATPRFLREAYGWAVPKEADRQEAHVASKAALTVYSSKEMAARASADLDLTCFPTETLPFGINFETLPDTCPRKPSFDKLKLLFVGLDWERKGGDIAVSALDRLRDMGIAAHLTVVGRCPERHSARPDLTYVGFLNKNTPADMQRLSRLYSDSHLLLVPSRADCSPMVIAEAMAHGTPVIATETGGVASLIGSGGTGRMLPLYSSPTLWAERIQEMTANPDAYAMLSDACFDRGQTDLSWDNWAAGMEQLVRSVVTGRMTAEQTFRLAVSA